MKLADALSPITKIGNIINETTETLGDVIKQSNLQVDNLKFLPNSSNFSISEPQMIESFINSRISVKITQDEFGQANFLGFPFHISGYDRIEIKDNIYD